MNAYVPICLTQSIFVCIYCISSISVWMCMCVYVWETHLQSIRAESKYVCLIERTDDTAWANPEMPQDKFDKWMRALFTSHTLTQWYVMEKPLLAQLKFCRNLKHQRIYRRGDRGNIHPSSFKAPQRTVLDSCLLLAAEKEKPHSFRWLRDVISFYWRNLWLLEKTYWRQSHWTWFAGLKYKEHHSDLILRR